MSGEGVIGVGVMAVAGSAYLAAKGIQVGAMVAARSVDLLGAGLVIVGDRAERSRAEWEADHAIVVAWEAAARRVIDVNARIQVLAQHAAPDLAAGLPAPLAPCAESPAELDAWCASAAAAVGAVERELRERTASAVLAVMRHSVDLERPVTAKEAFDLYDRAMADEALRRRAVPTASLVAVGRILARLAPDVSDDDRSDVLAAAAQVAVPRPDVDADTLLDELRLRVQRAGERAAVRAADAVMAARMLQAIPAGVDGPDLPGLRVELTAVVAGQRALDQGLRLRVEEATERVRVALERDYVRASVADTLAELGYEVDQEFATVVGSPDRMRLVRPDWNGHAVQVVVDSDEVRAAVVRLEDRPGTDARREDVEREEQWCEDLVVLRAALDGSGVRVVERRLVAPGERVVPVVKRRSSTDPRTDTVARERGK